MSQNKEENVSPVDPKDQPEAKCPKASLESDLLPSPPQAEVTFSLLSRILTEAELISPGVGQRVSSIDCHSLVSATAVCLGTISPRSARRLLVPPPPSSSALLADSARKVLLAAQSAASAVNPRVPAKAEGNGAPAGTRTGRAPGKKAPPSPAKVPLAPASGGGAPGKGAKAASGSSVTPPAAALLQKPKATRTRAEEARVALIKNALKFLKSLEAEKLRNAGVSLPDGLAVEKVVLDLPDDKALRCYASPLPTLVELGFLDEVLTNSWDQTPEMAAAEEYLRKVRQQQKGLADRAKREAMEKSKLTGDSTVSLELRLGELSSNNRERFVLGLVDQHPDMLLPIRADSVRSAAEQGLFHKFPASPGEDGVSRLDLTKKLGQLEDGTVPPPLKVRLYFVPTLCGSVGQVSSFLVSTSRDALPPFDNKRALAAVTRLLWPAKKFAEAGGAEGSLDGDAGGNQPDHGSGAKPPMGARTSALPLPTPRPSGRGTGRGGVRGSPRGGGRS